MSEELDLQELIDKIQTSQVNEIFLIVKLFLEGLNYDWLDRENDTWLSIAYRLEQLGETELAQILTVANQRCFQLQLKH